VKRKLQCRWRVSITEAKRIQERLRTRDGVRPLYVSPGHGVSVETARRWALSLVGRYRLTEPTRQAHLFVGSLKGT